MTNTYRPISVLAKSTHGEDPVELDLSPMDEKDALDGGHLELVPRKYKVLSDNFSGGPQNGEYVGALRVETEQALIQGGHIERDDEPASSKEAPSADDKPATKAADKKEK